MKDTIRHNERDTGEDTGNKQIKTLTVSVQKFWNSLAIHKHKTIL